VSLLSLSQYLTQRLVSCIICVVGEKFPYRELSYNNGVVNRAATFPVCLNNVSDPKFHKLSKYVVRRGVKRDQCPAESTTRFGSMSCTTKG
jgi:hypothetical protein